MCIHYLIYPRQNLAAQSWSGPAEKKIKNQPNYTRLLKIEVNVEIVSNLISKNWMYILAQCF